jgi:hypothetical protein
MGIEKGQKGNYPSASIVGKTTGETGQKNNIPGAIDPDKASRENEQGTLSSLPPIELLRAIGEDPRNKPSLVKQITADEKGKLNKTSIEGGLNMSERESGVESPRDSEENENSGKARKVEASEGDNENTGPDLQTKREEAAIVRAEKELLEEIKKLHEIVEKLLLTTSEVLTPPENTQPEKQKSSTAMVGHLKAGIAENFSDDQIKEHVRDKIRDLLLPRIAAEIKLEKEINNLIRAKETLIKAEKDLKTKENADNTLNKEAKKKKDALVNKHEKSLAKVEKEIKIAKKLEKEQNKTGEFSNISGTDQKTDLKNELNELEYQRVRLNNQISQNRTEVVPTSVKKEVTAVELAKKNVQSANNEVALANKDVSEAKIKVARKIRKASKDQRTKALPEPSALPAVQIKATLRAIKENIFFSDLLNQVWSEMTPDQFLISHKKEKAWVSGIRGAKTEAWKAITLDYYDSSDIALAKRKELMSNMFIGVLVQDDLLAIEGANTPEEKCISTTKLITKIEKLQKYLEQSNIALEYESKKSNGKWNTWWHIFRGPGLQATFARAVLQSFFSAGIGVWTQYLASQYNPKKIVANCLKSLSGSASGASSSTAESITNITNITDLSGVENMINLSNLSDEENMTILSDMSEFIVTKVKDNPELNATKLCAKVNLFLNENKEEVKEWTKDFLELKVLDFLRGDILDKFIGDNEIIKKKLLIELNVPLVDYLQNVSKGEKQSNAVSTVIDTSDMDLETALCLETAMAFVKGIVSPMIDSWVEKDTDNKIKINGDEAKDLVAHTKAYVADWYQNAKKQGIVGVNSLAVLCAYTAITLTGPKVKNSEIFLNVFFTPVVNAFIDVLRSKINFTSAQKEALTQLLKLSLRALLARGAVLATKKEIENDTNWSPEDYNVFLTLLAGGFGKEMVGSVFQYLAKKDKFLSSDMGNAALSEKDVFQLLQEELTVLKAEENSNKLGDPKRIERIDHLEYLKYCFEETLDAIKEKEDYVHTNRPADKIEWDMSRASKNVIEYSKKQKRLSIINDSRHPIPDTMDERQIGDPPPMERSFGEWPSAMTEPINNEISSSSRYRTTSSGGSEIPEQKRVSNTQNGGPIYRPDHTILKVLPSPSTYGAASSSKDGAAPADRAAPATKNAKNNSNLKI